MKSVAKIYSSEQMAGLMVYAVLEKMNCGERQIAVKNNPASIRLMENAGLNYSELLKESAV